MVERDRNLQFLPRAFIVFVVIYFAMLTRPLLTIDAETAIIEENPSLWLPQGRWFAYLIQRFLFPDPVIQYWTLAFFGLCAATAFWLLIKACELGEGRSSLIGFGIFIGFPIWSLLLEFPANTPSSGIALVLIGAATYSMSRKDWGMGVDGPNVLRTISEIVLVTLAIGAYQAFSFIFVTAVLCLAFFRERWVRILVDGAGVTVAALVVYFLINRISLHISGMNEDYISGFLNTDIIISHPIVAITETMRVVISVYSGAPFIYGVGVWGAAAIVVVAMISVVVSREFRRIMILIATLLSPFPMVLLNGGLLPLRILIGVPVAIWLCATILLNHRSRYVRWFGTVVSVILILESVSAVSQYETERHFIAKHDQEMAGMIYERISELTDLRNIQKVDFFGRLEVPRYYDVALTSSADGSFFSWDGGNPYRIVRYMKVLGYTNIKYLTDSKRAELKPLYAAMPSWPAQGSVKLHDGVVMIKLGDVPGYYGAF
ncbi:glucosyltransferase domain-containing protein [Consotaella salsifontis]|uniref:Glucosyl transferase GtrII n=1 Tax=Consotaella salsifontis TaxID=1365950 RepID=A0A1T4P2Z7_9HYPH|nr:glucosyltransferase domain-containing protein [Consotaella salsifontis]SJZ85328.1 Glucosyl transferase GtrII [Consotaella salsifontis]